VLEGKVALHLSFFRILQVCLSSELLRRRVFVNTFHHIREALLGGLCLGSFHFEKLDVLAVAATMKSVL